MLPLTAVNRWHAHSLNLTVSSAIAALTLGLTAVLQTSRCARDCSVQMRANR
jgi:hypothetical protein